MVLGTLPVPGRPTTVYAVIFTGSNFRSLGQKYAHYFSRFLIFAVIGNREN